MRKILWLLLIIACLYVGYKESERVNKEIANCVAEANGREYRYIQSGILYHGDTCIIIGEIEP